MRKFGRPMSGEEKRERMPVKQERLKRLRVQQEGLRAFRVVLGIDVRFRVSQLSVCVFMNKLTIPFTSFSTGLHSPKATRMLSL